MLRPRRCRRLLPRRCRRRAGAPLAGWLVGCLIVLSFETRAIGRQSELNELIRQQLSYLGRVLAVPASDQEVEHDRYVTVT